MCGVLAQHHRPGLPDQRIGVTRQLGAHYLLNEAHLAGVVLRQAEAQQTTGDEIGGRPAVDHDIVGRARHDIRHELTAVTRLRRDVESHRVERRRVAHPQRVPLLSLLLAKVAVSAIQVQQILALYVERERAGVGGLRTEQLPAARRLEDHVQSEQRERRLRRHA